MTTINKRYSNTDSIRSLEAKVDHYANNEAYKKGVAAAREKYPADLTPVEFYTKPELAEEWHKGFRDEMARIKQCVR